MSANLQALLPLARIDLGCYAKLIYPGYQLAPHHRILIEQVEAVARGEITRLVVNLPPRHGKTLTGSQLFVSWYLGSNPEHSVIYASYSQEIADDSGRRVRNFLAEPVHRAVFPGCVLSADSQAASRFHTSSGGSYFAVGRGGPITGRGANLLILDDMTKDAEESRSETIRKTLKQWYSETAYTRLAPGGAVVLIQTRWHEDDLAGFLTREHQHQGWRILSLPALAEEGDPLGRAQGAPLWPERYGIEELEATRRQLGSAAFTSLYQQRPSAAEGQIFKREWWRFYTTTPEFTKKIVSVDAAVKTGQQNDYSVLQVWGEAKTGYYLLANFKARVEFPELIAKIKQFHGEWRTHQVLIEDASSGQSAIQTLKRESSLPIRAVKVDKDKVARANAVVPLLESERVFLPQGAPWLDDYLDELSSFPNAAHDDQVDATTQALNHLREKNLILGVAGYYKRVHIREGGCYDPQLFAGRAEYDEIRQELERERQADESEKLSPEDAKLHAEQADRRRIQIEQHQQSLQRPGETIKLKNGSTLRYNRVLDCWQDVLDARKTYKNCPGPTHVEGQR